MATDKNISAFIESQVPEYLREEGPKLVSFLKAYYEWMETTGQVTDQSKNLLNNRDIDNTDLNKFYEYFRREVLVDFPEAVLADKRLVTKRIKDLYRSKGSKLSYKLLFRILYNEEIDFINPADFILKTSDGRWSKDAFIRLGPPSSGNLESLLGEYVTGQTSGARGKVTEVFTTVDLGIQVKQLRITDIVGRFTDKEVVLGDNGVSGTIVNSIGPLANVSFSTTASDVSGGSGHQLGDSVSITSSIGSGATGIVTGTTDSAVTFDLIDGGSGYRKADTVVSITGGSGSGGAVVVESISNPETINTYSDTIYALANTTIGFGPNYGSSANTNTVLASANLESSNAYSALSSALGIINTVVGTINSISVTTGSYIDNLPTVTVVDEEIALLRIGDGSGGIKGKNARIRSRFIPGAITSISITNGGSSYSSLFKVTVQNTTRSGTINAQGTPVVTGVLEDPGQYLESKGFLSWDMKLQDGYYYQDYSYVIKSDKGLQVYEDIVTDVLHPAGSKLFGAVDLNSEIDYSSQYDIESTATIDLISGDDLTITSTVTFSDFFTDRNIDPVSLDSTVQFGNLVAGRVLEAQSILSTAALPSHSIMFTIVPESIEETTIGGLNNVEFGPIDLVSISGQTTLPTNTLLLLDGAGTVYVSNNNIIDTYLGQPITNYLTAPAATFGSPYQVIGIGTSFANTLTGGVTVEIEDLDPGVYGNTTYIVNTVFSNTTFTINTPYGGGVALANGVYRYTWSDVTV